MNHYKVNPNATERQVVGILDLDKINGLLGTNFTRDGEVFLYPGRGRANILTVLYGKH